MEKKKINIKGILFIALLVVATALCLSVANRLRRPRRDSHLTIEKTANVVEKISDIARLTTACYYEELVIVREKPNPIIGILNDEICMIAKGTVRAGYDLSGLDAGSVRFASDTLIVDLPAPDILDIQVNPSDCEIYVREGKWTDEELASMQREARNRLFAHAFSDDIISNARESGQNQIRSLLNSIGYPIVVFE